MNDDVTRAPSPSRSLAPAKAPHLRFPSRIAATAGLLPFLLLAGCSSTPTHVDSGPVKARTFSYVHQGNMPTRDFTENREPVHALIQQAISRHLGQKGLAQVAEGGEVTVGYLVIVGNNATTESINDYFGYGRDAEALEWKAHKAYTSDNKNPNYFQAGTLIIDLVDSRTYKLLFRNHVTRSILQNATPETRQARIQEAVDEALGELRIGG